MDTDTSEPQKLVRLYKFVDEDWETLHTGILSFESPGPTVLAITILDTETNQPLFRSEIVQTREYEQNEDSIITWEEEQSPYGLSFANPQFCDLCISRFKGHIKLITGQLEATITNFITDPDFVIPAACDGNLESILNLIVYAINDASCKHRVAALIMDSSFISQVAVIIETAYTVKNVQTLKTLYDTYLYLFLYNYYPLINYLLNDENISTTIAALEFNPYDPTPVFNDIFCKQTAVSSLFSIQDSLVITSINCCFRSQFIRENVLQLLIEEEVPMILTLYMKHHQRLLVEALQSDPEFQKELWELLDQSAQEDASTGNDLNKGNGEQVSEADPVQETDPIDINIKNDNNTKLDRSDKDILSILSFLKELIITLTSISNKDETGHDPLPLQIDKIFEFLARVLDSSNEVQLLAAGDVLVRLTGYLPSLTLIKVFSVPPPPKISCFSRIIALTYIPRMPNIRWKFCGVVVELCELTATQYQAPNNEPINPLNLNMFYPQHATMLFSPLLDIPNYEELSSTMVGKDLNDSIDIYYNLTEILCLCIDQHAYRIQYIIYGEKFLSPLCRLLKYPSLFAKSIPARVFRRMLKLNLVFVVQNALEEGILTALLQLYLTLNGESNLLTSSLSNIFQEISLMDDYTLLKAFCSQNCELLLRLENTIPFGAFTQHLATPEPQMASSDNPESTEHESINNDLDTCITQPTKEMDEVIDRLPIPQKRAIDCEEENDQVAILFQKNL